MLLLVSLALAHSGLEDPPPRYDSDGFSNNKACPCGVGTGGGLCSGDTSDPDRSTTVTTYMAGETITMRWAEAVGHAGRWRVAFDADGADVDDFNDTILLDIEDPPGDDGNIGEDEMWEVQITLPTTPCTNCTLQLVQMMDGNTVDLVPDPTGRSSYYQCADIVLLAAADTGLDTADDIDTGTPTDTDTDADTDTDTDTDDGTDDDTVELEEDDKGCGCQSSSPWTGMLVLLPLLGLRRRGDRR